MKSVCALAGIPCPRTNDPNSKYYCPHWVVGIPETELDGSGRVISARVYTGCQLPKLISYMLAVTAEADHAHAAASQARDASISARALIETETASNARRLVSLLALGGLGGCEIYQGERNTAPIAVAQLPLPPGDGESD